MSLKETCKKCNEDFLIIDKEINFYEEKDYPLATECPKCRRERRVSDRHERELYGYNCDSCGKDIVVAFQPKEEMDVYCKECYQKYMEDNDCIIGYSEGYKKQMNKDSSNV